MELRKGSVDLVLKPLLDFLRPKQRQLDVSQQNSVAPSAYCFVTSMLFAPVVSVNPAV